VATAFIVDYKDRFGVETPDPESGQVVRVASGIGEMLKPRVSS
jgi:hypothetical protein